MPQSPDISDRWFPGYPLDAGNCALIDQRYRDFDAQAERLTGHDQSYIQLTPGPFQGRSGAGFCRRFWGRRFRFTSNTVTRPWNSV